MTFWLIASIVFLLDRVSKNIIISSMELGESHPVITGFFHITYVKNSGAAFGMLAEKRWLFVVVTIGILAILIYLAHSQGKGRLGTTVTLGMVAGGALGNLLDRVQTGLVTDFIDFRGIWPYVFNIADAAIVIGVLLLSWQILMAEKT